MAIDAMAVTNSKHPVVLNISKILREKEGVLIFFVRFVRNHSFGGHVGYFANRVLEPSLNKGLDLSSWVGNIEDFFVFLDFDFLCIQRLYVGTRSYFYLFAHVFHMCDLFWIKNRVLVLFCRVVKLYLCFVELSSR